MGFTDTRVHWLTWDMSKYKQARIHSDACSAHGNASYLSLNYSKRGPENYY